MAESTATLYAPLEDEESKLSLERSELEILLQENPTACRCQQRQSWLLAKNSLVWVNLTFLVFNIAILTFTATRDSLYVGGVAKWVQPHVVSPCMYT